MLNILDDIERALEAEAYCSALALALTLPDVLGRVAYPELRGNGNVQKRYEKWYNENMEDKDKELMNGLMCYKLRCTYLHTGETELNQREKDEFPIFQLRKGSTSDIKISNGKTKQGYMAVDVVRLCEGLCQAAKKFYERCNHKQELDKFYNICDVDLEVNKINAAQLIYINRKEKYSGTLSNKAKEYVERLKKISNEAKRPEEFIKTMMTNSDTPEDMASVYELMEFFCFHWI